MAGDAGSELSRGGMVTKLVAAKIAVNAGSSLVITNGKVLNPLRALGEGAPCTWFLASTNPMISRKRWIAGALEPRGADHHRSRRAGGARSGAQPAARRRGQGRRRVRPRRRRRHKDPDGREVGRGLIAYSNADAERLVGRKSAEIEGILGYRGRSEMIHRDDMALNRSG